MQSFPDIGAHLRRLGKAMVYVGDIRTAGGMQYLGATEGVVNAQANPEYNETVFPEETGPAVHEADLMGENPVVTIPLIIYDIQAQMEIASPTGSPSGGHFGHRPVQETSLLLVPYRAIVNLDPAEFGYDGTAWTPADFDRRNLFGITRGYFHRPGIGYQVDDGNKRIEELEFRGLYDKSEYHPDGLRSYFAGDPVAQGFTDFRL
jgi:hypothetical protein